MYKHGRPTYKLSNKPFFIAVILILLLIGGVILAINIFGSKTTLKNNGKGISRTVKVSDQNTQVNEPDFSFSLPGKWQLDVVNWDARYRAWQWKFVDPHYAGRLFRVYEDTIPSNLAINYMQPVTANGDSVQVGQISGNCADFTTEGQKTTDRNGDVTALSKWQGINFLCDYARTPMQAVGTSSPDGINTVVLQGASGKSHKYFFWYQDNNFSPDYGVMVDILGTFHAK